MCCSKFFNNHKMTIGLGYINWVFSNVITINTKCLLNSVSSAMKYSGGTGVHGSGISPKLKGLQKFGEKPINN